MNEFARTTGANVPLWKLGAHELATKLRAGEISAREATESSLARLREANPLINAVVEDLAGEALAAADAADRLAASIDPAKLPALHGVPVTVKINVDLAGHATTDGVEAFRQRVATQDHSSVANLKHGGAILIGRTNTPAFSFRWLCDNDLHGRTLNPWDRTLTPGGSSGGAASAVAAGIGHIAHGNDIAGSVRYPAYCCGVAGIRPTVGLVPSYNPTSAQHPTPLSVQLMGVQGLLARKVEDLRLSLPVLARPDPRDPTVRGVEDAAALPLRPGTPIAVLRELPGTQVDASVVAGLDAAVAALQAAGYRVEEVTPPGFREAAELWTPMVLNEIGPVLAGAADQEGDHRIRNALKTWLEVTPPTDLPGFSAILARRFSLRSEWSVFFQRYPVLITPVSWQRPFPYDLDQKGPEVFVQILDAQSPSLAISMLGLPGLCVPTGVFQHLPTAVQVVAPWFREDLCFDVGAVIEAAAGLSLPVDPLASGR